MFRRAEKPPWWGLLNSFLSQLDETRVIEPSLPNVATAALARGFGLFVAPSYAVKLTDALPAAGQVVPPVSSATTSAMLSEEGAL